MTTFQKNYFLRVVRRTSVQKNISLRAEILLRYSESMAKRQIARDLGASVQTVRKWIGRWNRLCADLAEIETVWDNAENYADAVRQYEQKLFEALRDAPRSGAPQSFSAEELALIVALSCESLDESDEAVSYRTQAEIAQEAVRRQLVESISQSTVCRILKNSGSEAA